MRSQILVTNPTKLPELFLLVKYQDVDIEKLQEKVGLPLGDLYIYRKAKWEILAVEVLK